MVPGSLTSKLYSLLEGYWAPWVYTVIEEPRSIAANISSIRFKALLSTLMQLMGL